MKKYSKYKHTNVGWIDDIPTHWQFVELKRFLTVSSGDFHNSEDMSDENIGYPIYGGNGLRGYSSKYNSEGELLLIGRVGAKCGNVHLVNGRCWISEHALKVISKKEFAIRYFKYLIERIDLNQYAIKTAQPLINTSIVEQQLVCVPPISEQTAIANFLDHKTRQIDDLIAKKERLIELLKEERTAIINQAVTKGLPAEVRAKAGLDPNVPMKDSGIEWLGKIPEHWGISRIKTLIEKNINGVWGNEPNEDDYDLVCVRVADFNMDELGVDSKNLTYRSIPDSQQNERLLFKNNLLIEKSGGGEKQPVGRVIRYNLEKIAVCSNFIAKLELSNDSDPNYMVYVFNFLYSIGVNTRSIKQTTGIQNLDTGLYFNERIPKPPLLKQIEIGKFIDQKIQEIELQIKLIKQEIILFQEYKTSLINEAVTGKIDVRDYQEYK